MSLLRNSRGQVTNTVTVKRFLDNAAFATRTRGSVTYSYYSREWVGLNNYYLIDGGQSTYNHLGFDASCLIVIRCTLATDAVGPLFGVTGKARVMCEGGSIKWYDDSGTAVHTVAIDGERHDIGVYSDNGSLKPFYDGAISANAMTSRTIARDFYPCVLSTDTDNGAPTGTCLSSASQTYAIKIHEIAGTFVTRTSSSSQPSEFRHFYSCNINYSETVPYMFETRARNVMVLTATAGSSITGVTAAAGLGNHVTYGVQLHDLQEAFNTYYTQLLAVLCDDGGVDRGGQGAEDYYAGWEDPVSVNPNRALNADYPETFVSDDKTFKSAFYLAESHLPANKTDWTKPADYAELEDGQLIRGRKPKWFIWNDAINFGKYIKTVQVGGNYVKKVVFNIFRDIYGRNIFTLDNPDLLAIFDGYNTAMGTNYAPYIKQPSDSFNLKFYDDMGFDPAASPAFYGTTYAYPYDILGTGSFTARLGNLPWWNVPNNELIVGDKDCVVYGMAVRLQMMESSEWKDIIAYVALTEDRDGNNQLIPLCADSTPETKAKFKTDGVELSMTYGKYAALARLENTSEFRTRGVLSMMHSPVMIITDQNTIDCSSLVPSVQATASVERHLQYMAFIGEQGAKMNIGSTAYDIYLQSNMFPANHIVRTSKQESASEDHRAMGLQFMLIPSNITSPTLNDAIDLFNNDGTPKVFVYGEFTQMRSWAAMLGSYSAQVVVSTRSSFPSSGNSNYNYVDRNTGKLYHWVGGTAKYAEDTETEVNALPSTGSYFTTYVYNGKMYRWSKVLVDEGQTGNDAYVELPKWALQGSIYNKYNGFAVPFRYSDVYEDKTYAAQTNPWGRTDNVFYHGGNSVSSPNSNSSKKALSVFFFNRLDLSNHGASQTIVDGPKLWKRNSSTNDDEPRKEWYRVVDASSNPHAWGVYNKNKTFCDAGEGWQFGMGDSVYLVIDNDHLLLNEPQTIIRAYMRLESTDGTERILDSQFKPFKVSVYRQDASRPYLYENGSYQYFQYYYYKDPRLKNGTIDNSTLCTQILTNLSIPICNTNYTKTEGGMTFTTRVYASTNLDDGAVKYNGVASNIQDKYGSADPYAYLLEIKISGTPVAGATYLFDISPI